MSSDGPRSAANQFPLHVLREYAFLADGERGILVGPRGEFAWMCAPRWDSDAVFASLIGGAGMYAVSPPDGSAYVWGGHYEPGTLIWLSRWVTTSQIIQCREALAFPGDPHTAVVLRRVLAIDGDTRVRVVLDPRAGFGRNRWRDLSLEQGVWTGRCGNLHVRWTGCPDAVQPDGPALEAEIKVAGGSHHDLVLEISDVPFDEDPPDPNSAWRTTEAAWKRSLPDISGTVADREARLAYLVLRGLTGSGGGMAAAATMSLPERAEQGRNYDYRYAWIRDQCLAGQAIARAGSFELLDSSVAFVSERIRADGPQLKPAYTVTGGPVPDEHVLDLPGYPGGSPRTGNWVSHQFQLDSLGEALLLFASASERDRLDGEHWRAVETTVAAIEKRRGEEDAGIWELEDRRWAHSGLTCAAGLRAIAQHAPARQGGAWTALADKIVSDITAHCLHPTGRWQRSPEDERVDAALLIPALRGATRADDPRTLATLEAVLAELGQEGYMYRFRHDAHQLGEVEGAFLLCGFITALALDQQGRSIEAIRWFERNRAACGSPGVMSEEYDVQQRQLRGNVPQAFVHALLFECCYQLSSSGPTENDSGLGL